MRRWALLGVLAAGAAWASPAAAQPRWDTPSARGFELVPRSGAAGELTMWAAAAEGEDQVGHLSGLLRAGLVLEQVLEIGLVAGWAWTDFDQQRDALGAIGNHGAAANTLLSVMGVAGEQRWRFRFGAGATIPAGLTSSDARLASFYGAAVRGGSELWLWAADRVSAVGLLQLQLMPLDFFYLELGAEGAAMFSVYTGEASTAPDNVAQAVALSTGGDVDATIQLRAAAALRDDNFMGGLRFRSVITPTLDANTTQSSLEAFLRGTLRLDDSSIELFAEASFLVNLDPPLGFAFEPLGVWGAGLSFGLSSTPQEVPDGRYGVAGVHFEGVDQLDEQSLAACLGTRQRPRFGIDIGVRGEPSCGEAPFDGDHLLVQPFSWPFTEWPLFDENVFERDLERIERWYRARGYYDARVTASELQPPTASTVDRRGQGCGDGDGNCEVHVTFQVDEGEPVRIARMSLRGVDDLPDGMRELLREQLNFSRDDPFDEALYEDTKRRMVRALADAGYAHARVDGDVKINVGRREAFVIFSVDAGPPNVIGRVCVVGFGELPPEPLIVVSGLEAGQTFSLAALEEAQRALYRLGVLGAVDVHPEGDQEGEDEGDEEDGPVDQDSVADVSDRTSAQLGHDQRTEGPRYCADPPRRVRDGAEAADILIEVTPGRRYRIGIGGGFQAGQAVTFGTVSAVSSQQNAAQWDLHLSFSVEDRNFADSMIRARFEVRPRFIFNMPFLSFDPAEPLPFGVLANGSMRWPNFLGARWLTLLGQTRADLGPMPFTNFFRLELDASIGPEAQFFENRLYLGLFAHVNYFLPTDRQPVLPEDRLPETYASWIEETIRIDLRDDPRSPTLGAYFAITGQQGFQPLSTWTMVRLTAEARGYVPLFAGVVLAGRFQIGMMEVLGYDEETLLPGSVYQLDRLGPPALHLTGGGASSNRGYLPGLLGDATQVYVTEPLSDSEARNGSGVRARPVRVSGGQRLWLASLEVRVPVSTSLGVVAFADVGDNDRQLLGESGVGWRFDHLQLAVGLGIRYQTIIGPLRFDVAVRPDETLVVGGNSQLPRDCTSFDAGGSGPCRPRSQFFQIGDFAIPGAFHLTIGESF